ncbi:acetolactate synthase, small subunit [Acetitomaculum ruminis DSM 5522]|uniref:Acetolactate synthase small subunit n=1 Tax=Acetitomaculum ruminis DSM 5522 TaxID=1120918 RepID=A0A1I0VSH5_9FIRM|nr:acetolactate synthase small subunit [Acetitomaculum ruminis]SFA78967.1 acetolactate synthase, small subunit [Acetitomaculum ruminis DSM 5522]
MSDLKKRWMSLYVENQVGVLAKVSGLFSAKSYNLQTLTVGETEDETVSRMTISVDADDITYEQIKKQLNRMVEVIKVIDMESGAAVHMKEILYAKINHLDDVKMNKVFQIAKVFDVNPVDMGCDSVILECVLTESLNNDLIKLLKKEFKTIEIVRGGNVAIESINKSDR